MRPYSMEFSDAFWTGVRARIEPILGDVRQKFGKFWIDQIEASFPRTDWMAVQQATTHGGKLPSWYVLEWHEAALEVCGDDDYLVAGESREECLAHLADRCTYEGIWPTSFTYQERGDKTTFTLNNMLFAVIRPVASPTPLDDRKRSRVESTLLGLEQAESQTFEFKRRFAKWPGVENICAESFPSPREPRCHWPCPSEWLASARLLLRAAGLPDSGTAQAQALAAAAFGQKSWNHLCGLMPADSHKSAWWSMCCPYYVHEEDAGDHSTIRVFQDVVEGFIDFHSRAARACGHRDGVEISYSRSPRGLPCITLESEPAPPSPEWALPRQDTLACLLPVNPVVFEDVWLERVCDATKDGYIPGLSRLFMIDEPIETKRERRAVDRGHVEIAFDGPWHFFIMEEPAPIVLFAELYSADGRKIGTAGVSVHKGAVLWDSDLDSFILTSEYHGRRPVAILKGLSNETVAKLKQALPLSAFEQRMYRPASQKPVHDEGLAQMYAQEDQFQLARLLASMTDAGSVG